MSGFNSTGSFGFTGGGGGGGGGSIINGLKICSLAQGTTVIDTTKKSGNNSVFYNYAISDCVNMRCGTLMCIWDSDSNTVKFAETSTQSIGDTSSVVFTFAIVDDEVQLVGTLNSPDWKFSYSKVILPSCCAISNYLITESGDFIITENDEFIIT